MFGVKTSSSRYRFSFLPLSSGSSCQLPIDHRRRSRTDFDRPLWASSIAFRCRTFGIPRSRGPVRLRTPYQAWRATRLSDTEGTHLPSLGRAMMARRMTFQLVPPLMTSRLRMRRCEGVDGWPAALMEGKVALCRSDERRSNRLVVLMYLFKCDISNLLLFSLIQMMYQS